MKEIDRAERASKSRRVFKVKLADGRKIEIERWCMPTREGNAEAVRLVRGFVELHYPGAKLLDA